MNTVHEIKRSISKLSLKELAAFRAWFAESDAEVWDRQFEQDVAAGRFSALAEEAIKERGDITPID